MLEVLQFIFQDFWHFAGTWLLLIAICPWNNIKIVSKKKDKEE